MPAKSGCRGDLCTDCIAGQTIADFAMLMAWLIGNLLNQGFCIWLHKRHSCIDISMSCSFREDFLRQTEYGYGEENLGADDLSELRAAADGHGPYAKYN